MQAFMSQSQPCCITSLPAVYLNPHVHQSARKPTDTQALAYREPLRKKTVIENNENKVYFLKHSRVNCPPPTHTHPPAPGAPPGGAGRCGYGRRGTHHVGEDLLAARRGAGQHHPLADQLPQHRVQRHGRRHRRTSLPFSSSSSSSPLPGGAAI